MTPTRQKCLPGRRASCWIRPCRRPRRTPRPEPPRWPRRLGGLLGGPSRSPRRDASSATSASATASTSPRSPHRWSLGRPRASSASAPGWPSWARPSSWSRAGFGSYFSVTSSITAMGALSPLRGADLGDPGVATRPLLEGRRDLGEQRVHDRLVADGLEDLAPVVQVALLGLGDQLLRDRPQHAGARLGGGDPAVLEQRRGEVRDDQLLVGGAAAEAGTLLGSGHRELSILSGRVRYRGRRPCADAGRFGDQSCSSSTYASS